MGDLRPDNGGPGPDEGSGTQPHGLPDLPPEWGSIVIPDDASELAVEADAVRRELRRAARRDRLRATLGMPPRPSSSLGLPLVIMTVAIMTTLVSLFVVVLGHPPSPSGAPSGAPAAGISDTAIAHRTGAVPTGPGQNSPAADLVLRDPAGRAVRLGDLTPAVVLLIDGCSCQPLVTAVAAAVPVKVNVLAVARSAPSVPAGGMHVRALADSDGALRARYLHGATPAGPAAIVLNGSGTAVAVIAHVASVADVQPLDPT